MTAKPAPADQAQEAAKLAAATFALWQEQWGLLAGDAEAQQNIQTMLELLGRNAAFWDGQFKTAGGATYGAAKNSPAAATGQPSSQTDARAASGAATAAAASGLGGAGLAQLAAAVAELAAKIDRIEQRLESQTAPKPGRAPRPRRKTPA